MCCKRIIVLNSKSYNFEYQKNTLYGLNIYPPVRISKNIFRQMVLSHPPWSVFLANFAQKLAQLLISLITYNTVAVLEIHLTNPLWFMTIESLPD